MHNHLRSCIGGTWTWSPARDAPSVLCLRVTAGRGMDDGGEDDLDDDDDALPTERAGRNPSGRDAREA